MSKNDKSRIAIFASGGGTTAEAVMVAATRGEIEAEIALLVASKTDIGAIGRAKSLNVATAVIDPLTYLDKAEYSEVLLEELTKHEIDLVSQNGWWVLTPEAVVRAYWGQIINQHPGPLDPGRADFGGKGMYGARVSCARLAFLAMVQANTGLLTQEDYFTEATAHITTNEYDNGDLVSVVRLELGSILSMQELPLMSRDLAMLAKVTQEVQTALLPLEHKNVIAALQLMVSGGAKPFTRENPLIKPEWLEFLPPAKKLAVQLFKAG